MPKSFIKQLAHVCIFSRDLEKSEAFYRDGFGFDIAFIFKRGTDKIGFYLDLGGRTFVEVFSKDSSRYDETNQINHFCFETEDIDGLVAHLRAQGIAVTDKKLGADNTWQSWTADPDGVKLEIFQYTADSMQFGPRGAVCNVDW